MVKIDIEEAGSPREVEEMDVRVNETVYRATPKLMMGPVESKQKSFLIKILILGVVLTFVSVLVIISFGIPFNPPKPGFVNNLVMIFVQPLLLIVFSVGASIRKVAVYYGDKHKWTKVQIVKFYGAIMVFIWVPMALVVTFSGFYPLTIYFIYIIAASFGTELLKRSPIVFSAETRKNPEWKEFFSYHTRDSNYIAAGSIVYTGYFLAYSALTKYIAAQIALSVVNFAIFTLAKQQFILGHKATRPMVVYNYFIFVGFSHTYTIFLFPFLESDLVFAALAFIQVFGSLAPLIFLFPRPVLLMRIFLNKHVKKFKDVYPDPNDVHGYAKHRREVVEEFCFNNLSFLVGVVGYLTISSSIRYTWNQPYFAFGIVTHQAYLQSIYYCWILGGIMVVTFFIVSIIINYKLGLNVWTLLFDVMGIHWDLWAIGYFTIFLNVMWILQKHYHIWYWMRKEEGVAFKN